MEEVGRKRERAMLGVKSRRVKGLERLEIMGYLYAISRL